MRDELGFRVGYLLPDGAVLLCRKTGGRNVLARTMWTAVARRAQAAGAVAPVGDRQVRHWGTGIARPLDGFVERG
jgi:hypothetical protein